MLVQVGFDSTLNVFDVDMETDDDMSVLQATCNALEGATKHGDCILVHLLREVIAHLEHAGAVLDPKSIQERGSAVRSS